MSYCHLLAGGLSNLDLLFGDVVSARIDDARRRRELPRDRSERQHDDHVEHDHYQRRRRVDPSPPVHHIDVELDLVVELDDEASDDTSPLRRRSRRRRRLHPPPRARFARRPRRRRRRRPRRRSFRRRTSTSSTTSTVHPTTTSTSSTTSTTLPNDADADGIGDSVDACPETPLRDVVDPSGCTPCPCDGVDGNGWARGAYVRCVREAAAAFDAAARRVMLQHARKSSCAQGRRHALLRLSQRGDRRGAAAGRSGAWTARLAWRRSAPSMWVQGRASSSTARADRVTSIGARLARPVEAGRPAGAVVDGKLAAGEGPALLRKPPWGVPNAGVAVRARPLV